MRAATPPQGATRARGTNHHPPCRCQDLASSALLAGVSAVSGTHQYAGQPDARREDDTNSPPMSSPSRILRVSQGRAPESGGSLASVGAADYAQLAFGSPDSVNVSPLSCVLPASEASLCKAIEGDFLMRNPPTYVPSNSG